MFLDRREVVLHKFYYIRSTYPRKSSHRLSIPKKDKVRGASIWPQVYCSFHMLHLLDSFLNIINNACVDSNTTFTFSSILRIRFRIDPVTLIIIISFRCKNVNMSYNGYYVQETVPWRICWSQDPRLHRDRTSPGGNQELVADRCHIDWGKTVSVLKKTEEKVKNTNTKLTHISSGLLNPSVQPPNLHLTIIIRSLEVVWLSILCFQLVR